MEVVGDVDVQDEKEKEKEQDGEGVSDLVAEEEREENKPKFDPKSLLYTLQPIIEGNRPQRFAAIEGEVPDPSEDFNAAVQALDGDLEAFKGAVGELDCGIDPLFKGHSLLQRAIIKLDAYAVAYLLDDQMADPNAVSLEHFTALDTFFTLVPIEGAEAAKDTYLNIFEALLRKGAVFNYARHFGSGASDEQETILHVIAEKSTKQYTNAELCGALIETALTFFAGDDAELKKQLINIQDSEGNTLLHQAARHGASTIVEYLLEMGADREIENNAGLKPLDIARDRKEDVNQLAILGELGKVTPKEEKGCLDAVRNCTPLPPSFSCPIM